MNKSHAFIKPVRGKNLEDTCFSTVIQSHDAIAVPNVNHETLLSS